jgi:hypothetical protein
MGDPLNAEGVSVTRHPFDLVVERLLLLGGVITFTSDVQVRAACPAHADRRPSLAVKRCEDRVLLMCHKGCTLDSMLRRLELCRADLFVGRRSLTTLRQVVATYDYLDSSGTLLARKKRSALKSFWWEQPDATARGGWRNGLGGGGLPGLYRRPELEGASRVFIVEGEKAVDRLRGLGLVATCGPAGASTWKTAWSIDLLLAVPAAEMVVLADNDRPGQRHAARVACDLVGVRGELQLKVTQLPGLPAGGDVVDWLEAGHSAQDLLEIVAMTPPWSAGASAQQRKVRRAAQAKLRMQRYRARRRGDARRGPGQAPDADANALAAVVALLKHGQRGSGRAVKDGSGRHGAPCSGRTGSPAWTPERGASRRTNRLLPRDQLSARR